MNGFRVIAFGIAVALANFAVVQARHVLPDRARTFSCSSGAACLQAISSGSSTTALVGTTSTGFADAVVASAFNGNAVYGSSSHGYGLVGSSGGAPGVFGESTYTYSNYASPGVYGYSNAANPGVIGYSPAGVGVTGNSISDIGVRGSATGYTEGRPAPLGVYGEAGERGVGVFGYGGTAVFAEGTAFVGAALASQGDTSTTYLLSVYNKPNNKGCNIDANANLMCSGSITGGNFRTRHHASTGQRVLAYPAEAASATIEDVGRARLFDGAANVEIPPDFDSVIDRDGDYYVFLTPLGDTRGLYVSQQTPIAFQVRENMRGRSSVAFEYRIVARPIDAGGDRLPAAPRMQRPQVAVNHPPPLQLPPPPKLMH